MPKALIITEKPSVARDIVQALGGFVPKAGGAYFESDDFVCSFAVGHIFQLFQPEDIDPAYRSWKLSLLPIIPRAFQLKPIQNHEQRIKQLRQLVERDDVRCLINACDAAREGELIFREIVNYLGCRKWVQRLWLQSMTPDAIRQGFKSLRDGTDLEGLGQAAECRSYSDWLIGMNATRAFTDRLRIRGEKSPWSVGRVQTPTLALLVERELQILAHRPRAFSKLIATFDAASHSYEGTWFDPAFKAKESEPERKDDRIFEREKAEAIQEKIQGQPASASETREESLRHAPYLFNLTGLQKYMAQRYKWSAKRTLEAAQRCYEQHKVLTYPRTSSSCLPSDYRSVVERLVQGLADDPDYGEGARYLLANGRRNDKRTFDDGKVSDHFAIIPTGTTRALGGDDAKVYDAVVRRFLATFHPPAVYDKVKRLTVIAGEHFRTGPVETLTVPGWLAVYDKKAPGAEERAEKSLPPLTPGKKDAAGVAVALAGSEIKQDVTRPPPRINEAGLLSLMEHAGRQVESEELATALMSAEGLGTAATRADIIQNLKVKEYVDDALRPTFKGIHLISTLQRVQAARLTSPELTARLELELAEVENGKRSAQAFMAEIGRYTTEVVEAARRIDWKTVYPDKEPLGFCPVCAGTEVRKVFERPLFYACASVTGPDTGCGFKIWKDLSGRYMDRSTVELLLAGGRTGELDGFRTRSGKDFKAALELRAGKVAFAGGETAPSPEGEAGAGGAKDSAGASGRSIAPCPIHAGTGCQVVEARTVYACETRLKAFAVGDKQPEGIMVGKSICQRPITEAELVKLLKDSVTPELRGFISKAGKPFSAKLRLAADGRAAFEFEARSSSEGKGRSQKFPRRRAARRGSPSPRRKTEAEPS